MRLRKTCSILAFAAPIVAQLLSSIKSAPEMRRELSPVVPARDVSLPASIAARDVALDNSTAVLRYRHFEPGEAVREGVELRILCAGDSITWGYGDRDGEGAGYRAHLADNLSGDDVVFAGTESHGDNMKDNYCVRTPIRRVRCMLTAQAAWNGRTIQYIQNHVGPSLEQRPNVVLLHAGTNDMNPHDDVSLEGDDPEGAARRLGSLIDAIHAACPDAVLLVAIIISSCVSVQSRNVAQYQRLIPGVVASRRAEGRHVLAVDFTTFGTSNLRDCVHPTDSGYALMGDYWYSFLQQVPEAWIQPPVGEDPERSRGRKIRPHQWMLLVSLCVMIFA